MEDGTPCPASQVAAGGAAVAALAATLASERPPAAQLDELGVADADVVAPTRTFALNLWQFLQRPKRMKTDQLILNEKVSRIEANMYTKQEANLRLEMQKAEYAVLQEEVKKRKGKTNDEAY